MYVQEPLSFCLTFLSLCLSVHWILEFYVLETGPEFKMSAIAAHYVNVFVYKEKNIRKYWVMVSIRFRLDGRIFNAVVVNVVGELQQRNWGFRFYCTLWVLFWRIKTWHEGRGPVPLSALVPWGPSLSVQLMKVHLGAGVQSESTSEDPVCISFYPKPRRIHVSPARSRPCPLCWLSAHHLIIITIIHFI